MTELKDKLEAIGVDVGISKFYLEDVAETVDRCTTKCILNLVTAEDAADRDELLRVVDLLRQARNRLLGILHG